MGVSTDAKICFGIPLKEHAELPWGQDDIEDWWVYTALGFTHIEGATDFHEKYDFLKDNPCPAELVWHCSHTYQMLILALPDTQTISKRGDVTRIYPDRMDFDARHFHPDKLAAFHDFIYKYNIPVAGEMGWYLVSYWG